MLRRLGIRGKVLAALSVPVLVLVMLAGLVSWQAVQQAREVNSVRNLISTFVDLTNVATAYQDERGSAVALVAKGRSIAMQGAYNDSRVATDAAVATATASLLAASEAGLPSELDAKVTALLNQFDTIANVRARIDDRDLVATEETASQTINAVMTGYERIITLTQQFPVDVADTIQDRNLAQVLAATAAVPTLIETYAQEEMYGVVVLDGTRSQASLLRLASMFPASDALHVQVAGRVRSLGLGGDFVVPPLGASFDGTTSYDGFRDLLATATPEDIGSLTSQQWRTSSRAEQAALLPLLDLLGAKTTTTADLAVNDANRTAFLTIAAAVLAVFLSIVTALAIARQIVNPLRALTAGAASVREALPRLVAQVAVPGQGPDLAIAHIPVTSRDEIGRLAAAFNDVNATTISVAQEQAALRGSIAEMFVNVARRDQVLLNRQLTFIDALERTEEDPTVLADLFRLDHLATRMRRNAESLLVLAGIDTGRRLRDTLPLSDVIRTASSEIEHYERVMLDLPVDPMMLGHTALPGAHLLAELLENATNFAEPGTPVHVSTGFDGTHVLVTVVDQGLGMSPEELADAHVKIRSTSAGEVLGAQRLGMFVVGRIAGRLGADVELSVAPSGIGTQATVRLPLSLFVDAASLPTVAPSVPVSAIDQGGAQRQLPVGAPPVLASSVPAPAHAPEPLSSAASVGTP
ncbi:MAG: sensor histidine kinase, partial [Cellulomonadaceae bacterium]|nr:sensor histidine kinase [Cellulomonadaceae bacterium]